MSSIFYRYGKGVIGTKSDSWGYVLQDGLGSTRQLATHEGVIAMSVAYTPWGDVLEYYGSGGIDFGYLGGMYDDATGLIYLGGGQYYDPVTGRMLTRGEGQSNPYKPGAYDPTGMMIAPLAMLGLVLGKKKKQGRWDTFIAMLVVCVVVGMSVTACNPPKTYGKTMATIYVSTPTGTAVVTVSAETVKNTVTPTTAPPEQTKTAITDSADPCDLEIAETLDPAPPTVPNMPAGYEDITELYLYMHENKYNTEGKLNWWWIEGKDGENQDVSFTILDFLDRILQTEFYTISNVDHLEDVKKVSIGSFCFFNTRIPGDDRWRQELECVADPSGEEIFKYIHERELLTGGKDYTLKNFDNSWEPISDWDRNSTYEYPLVEAFKSPKEGWLDWRNVNHSNAEDDIPVEWGNKVPGNQDEVYENMEKKAKTYTAGGGAMVGNETNQVYLINGNFHMFTFCQLNYYQVDPDKIGRDGTPNGYLLGTPGNKEPPHCGNESHWRGSILTQ